MKSLIIFDSNFGNTQKIAQEIAIVLSASAVQVDSFNPLESTKYDLLIFGTPIIGWRPTIKMQQLLQTLPRLPGIRATTFDTRVKLFIHGDAMGQLANAITKLGAKIIIKPMPFYVAGPQNKPYLLDGEIDKARLWANQIQSLLS